MLSERLLGFLFLQALFRRDLSFAPTIIHRQLTSLSCIHMTDASNVSPVLDKSLFQKEVRIVCLKISAKYCSEFMSKFSEYSLKRQKMKRILDNPSDEKTKLFLLSENIRDTSLADLPEELRRFAHDKNAEPIPHTLHIGYEHLGVEEVLKQIIPAGIEAPSSFEQAGHIAHMNLRSEALPYKSIIGQVILDKNPSLRTVVNKISNIASEYRTFPMELLAGEDDYLVTLRESGANFTFNFRDVYWNSRLQTEHQRIVDWILKLNLKRPVVVADMMAGVGPFAIPIAMAGINVYANGNYSLVLLSNLIIGLIYLKFICIYICIDIYIYIILRFESDFFSILGDKCKKKQMHRKAFFFQQRWQRIYNRASTKQYFV